MKSRMTEEAITKARYLYAWAQLLAKKDADIPAKDVVELMDGVMKMLQQAEVTGGRHERDHHAGDGTKDINRVCMETARTDCGACPV